MPPPTPGKALFLLILAAALSAAPAAAQNAPLVLPATLVEGLRKDDPGAAEAFLKMDQNVLSSRAADKAEYREMFERATELKDLSEIFLGPRDERAIRVALLERRGCRFCQKPPELKAWIAAHFPSFKSETLVRIDSALLEWRSLSGERERFLVARGMNHADWAKLELPTRADALSDWAKARLDALMKAHPKDRAGAEALARGADALDDFLDGAAQATLGEHVARAGLAASGLEEARLAVEKANDPKLRRALEEARNAPDLAASLAKLGAVFDGLGVDRPDLRAQGAPKAGQRFDAGTRTAVAGLLASGLMAQVKGTWAGAELEDFYAKTPLRVRVDPSRPQSLASYQDGVMSFNERFIEEWAQGKGKVLADLTRDRGLMESLNVQLAAAFVHEATHHRQDVWARANRVPLDPSWNTEVEAMQTMVLFTLEKAKRDPRYARALQESRGSSALARQTIELAERVQRDGPEFFRDSIPAWHYPASLSAEGVARGEIGVTRTIAELVDGELARRARLPPAEQRALDAAPALPLESLGARFEEALPRLRTAQLRYLSGAADADASMAVGRYETYRRRIDAAIATFDSRLAELESAPAPAAKSGPPPPATAGRPR